jgi:putative ABC transport system permease protein
MFTVRDGWQSNCPTKVAMNSLLLDIRYALRTLRKSPGATAVAALALALGIGVNTSCFIWVNALVLHPLPYPNLERIMALTETVPRLTDQRDLVVAPANALDWKEQSHAFEQMALYRPWNANLTGAHDPERVQACLVTANFFELLGMKPVLGRAFSTQEEEPAASGAVIVSHGFWQRRLGSNPNAVGRTMSIDNRVYTIAGVMPAEFDYPLATDLWAPLALSPQEKNQRAAHTLLVLGRLQPGVSVAEARAAMNIIARRLEKQYPQTNEERSIKVIPLRELTNEVTDTFVLLLWGTSTFVLLLACANIANLQLARATTRLRQFAVESALGASRLRIALRLLVESALVASLGGGVGIWLASWNLTFAKSRVPSEVLRFVAGMKTMHIDGRVAAFTVIVSLIAGILCSAPAVLLVLRANAAGSLSETLKEGGRSSSSGAARNRMRNVLVTAEVAMALILLVGAGLMVETFNHLLTANPGYNPKNLLTMQIALPASSYQAPEQISAYYDRALAALDGLSGVRATAASADLGATGKFYVEGRPDPRPGEARPDVAAVSGHYFETMEFPIRQGRAISPRDGADSPRVVVLSETMARQYWPDYPRTQDPIGRRVKLGDAQSPWLTVIGVSGDVKNWFTGQPLYMVYVPCAQAPSPVMTVLLRTTGDPLALASGARVLVRGVDRNPPIYDVETMEQRMAWQSSGVGGCALSMEIYAVVALLLAITGIYAVTSYAVAQRTHEIGVRMALGARQADVLKMVIGQSFRTAGAGLAIGLPSAFVLTRVASSLLFNVIPVDFLAFAGFTLLLGLATLLATYVPAQRAAKVDPAVALHNE